MKAFEVGDTVTVFKNNMFPGVYTIKSIRKCIDDSPNTGCFVCPGLIQFEECPEKNLCFCEWNHETQKYEFDLRHSTDINILELV